MQITDLYKQLFGRKGPAEGNVIDMAEHGRVGGLSTGQPFKYTVPIDPDTGVTLTGGAGTQYTEGNTDASITGNAMMFETDTVTSALGVVSSVNPLPVSASIDTTGLATDAVDTNTAAIQTAAEAIQAAVEGTLTVTGGGGGVEYTEGDTDATITGSAILWEDAADTLRAVSATKPLPVDLGSNNDVTVTGTVDLGATDNAVLDSIAAKDFATQTTLAAIDADTSNISTKIDTLAGAVSGTEMQVDVLTMPTVAVTGTFYQATQPVSAASLPLPSGAATAAKQPALGTAGTPSSDVITVQGAASMTALVVDGSAVTQPVSLASVPSHAVTNAGTFATQATLQTGSNVIGALTANQSVNVAQINGVATTMGNGAAGTGVQRVTIASDSTGQIKLAAGTAAIGKLTANSGVDIGDVDVTSLTGSTVAHDAADSGNPHKMGARAVSAEIAAVANNDRTDLLATLTGKLINQPYANPENFVSGAITTAMTGTTSTSLVAAPAAGLRNYITTIIVSNAHATVGTDVIIQDGSGGTTLMTIPAAAVYGGAVINLPVPLRQPTTATALYCANVTTGASTKVSAVGYKGA